MLPKPQFLISLYEYDLTTRYNAADVVSIDTHTGINGDLGNFAIILNKKAGMNYLYNDLAIGDRIKIWLGWNTGDLTGTPDFMGKIYQKISQTGKYLILKGRGNSEVLGRRIKSRTVWTDTEADDIVATVISDLSLGTDIAVDATAINVTEDCETYADILKKVSDYWKDAGTQIKNDYYVDNGDVGDPYGHLVWKARPIRTVGVETLTYGADIKDYTYTVDGLNIKNAFAVYGAKTPVNPTDPGIYGRKNPADGDSWTEATTGWTATTGALSAEAVAVKFGTKSVKCTENDDTNMVDFEYTHDPISVEGLAGYSSLDMWSQEQGLGNPVLYLYAPDSDNYFYSDDINYLVADTWAFTRLILGKNNEYDADYNPEGQWLIHGSPSWDNLVTIRINGGGGAGYYFIVDGLCYNFGRWRYAPLTDATSITAYDECDCVHIDDNLRTDAMCESKARTLLYQHKDPVSRLDLTVIGNNNILVGDQLSITLPPEGITATNYYVTSVDHKVDVKEDAWTTTATMLDTISCRNIPSVRKEEVLRQAIFKLQQISRNQKSVN